MSEARTTVLLSPKRSGSTAVFRMFQAHPGVGVAHVNPRLDNWEPNFWNFAADAIAGEPARFVARVRESLPFLSGRAPERTQDAFAMWDTVLDRLGPVVFDKTPKYLASTPGLTLLEAYIDSGRDVRLIGLIRDPFDTIASQFELWHEAAPHLTPQAREQNWIDNVRRLEALAARRGFPIIRYEDFARQPDQWGAKMFRAAGLEVRPECWGHVQPTNVGRAGSSNHPALRAWKPGRELLELRARWGYADREALLIEPKPLGTSALTP